MAPPVAPADRREPLPGLLGLPAFVWRKLSPTGRRVAAVAGVVLLAGLVTLTIVLAPRIAESKREQAAEQRREAARALAAERARLRAEQRPRRGTVPVLAAIPGVERAITADARARNETGELSVRVKRTDCRVIGSDGARQLLGCTAITSETEASEAGSGVLVGYPYKAAVNLETGRYALCKTSGRPGEGAYNRARAVPLPDACGV
jgi:hypothetical protein